MNPLGIPPALFEFSIGGFGPIALRWYSLMYMIGYLLGAYLLKKLSLKGYLKIAPYQIERYVFYLLIGMLLGARLAYVFIYNWDYYQNHLGEIHQVWSGGLSFHGAIVGMTLATLLFAKKYKLHFFHLSDCAVLCGSPGLFLGRIGNFINGELYGRVTESPLGMVFPLGGPLPRHPSQLYEGLGEGLFLAALLWILLPRVKRYGILTGVFLMGYGVVRFIVEFFRQPDAQLGYYFGGLTMGQILCLIMIVGSVFVFIYAKMRNLPLTPDNDLKTNLEAQQKFVIANRKKSKK